MWWYLFLATLVIGRFQPFTGLMHARWWFQDCHTVIVPKKDIWWYLQVWANFCSLLFGILLHFLCAENLKFSPTKKPIWVSCHPWVVWMVEEYGLFPPQPANRKSSGPSSVASPPQWHACQLPGRRTDLIFSSWDPGGMVFSSDISRHFLGICWSISTAGFVHQLHSDLRMTHCMHVGHNCEHFSFVSGNYEAGSIEGIFTRASHLQSQLCCMKCGEETLGDQMWAKKNLATLWIATKVRPWGFAA